MSANDASKSGKRRPLKGPLGERRRARRRALQALYQWQMTGQDAGSIAVQFAEEQDMQRVDVEYFRKLLHGVVDHHVQIDGALGEFADRDLQQIDALEMSVLRLAGFELKHCLEIPFRVVLDEAVDLAKDFGSAQSHSYVNGVLDRCASAWRSIEYHNA